MYETLNKNKHYGNIMVLSPEGIPMYRCDAKKANWHLKRNLAVWDNSEQNKLRLTFKPNGLGHSDNPELLEEQQNICCVCGSENELVKSHLVPRHVDRTQLCSHVVQAQKTSISKRC